MNATTLQAYALEKGVNFNWNTASNAEKAELAMQMFMDRTSQYAGNFARESEETFSGSFGAMKAAAQDFAANLFTGGDVTGPLKAFIESAGTFLKNGLGRMLLNAGSALPSLIPEMFQQLFSSLPELANLSGVLLEQSSSFVDAGIEWIMNLVNGFVEAMPALIEYVPVIVKNIADIINRNVPKLLLAAFNIIMTLGQGLIANIPNIVANIGSIIDAIFSVIQAVNWLSIGANIIVAIAHGVKSLFAHLPGMFINIVKGIKNAFVSNWSSIGTNIIKGIANGITSAVTGLVDIAIKACGQLVDGIKSFFGIASPSKLMAKQIGQYIPSGIAKGITQNMDSVSKAMDEVNSLIAGDGSSAVSAIHFGGSYSSLAEPNRGDVGSFNQTIYNYSPKALDPSETARLNRNATRQMYLAMKVNA